MIMMVCLYTNFTMFIYEQTQCLYTCIWTHIWTWARDLFVCKLTFVYTYYKREKNVFIIYVLSSVRVYKRAWCLLYTNIFVFAYAFRTGLYMCFCVHIRKLALYKFVFVYIHVYTKWFLYTVRHMFIYEHFRPYINSQHWDTYMYQNVRIQTVYIWTKMHVYKLCTIYYPPSDPVSYKGFKYNFSETNLLYLRVREYLPR